MMGCEEDDAMRERGCEWSEKIGVGFNAGAEDAME
jgi:hypothetical protein